MGVVLKSRKINKPSFFDSRHLQREVLMAEKQLKWEESFQICICVLALCAHQAGEFSLHLTAVTL